MKKQFKKRKITHTHPNTNTYKTSRKEKTQHKKLLYCSFYSKNQIKQAKNLNFEPLLFQQ